MSTPTTSPTSSSIISFHDHLIEQNGVWSATGFSGRGQHARFRVLHRVLLEECERYPDLQLSVLDYGCAVGDFYGYLTAHDTGYRTCYTGIDLNPKFIEAARERFKGRAARWSTGNILEHGTLTDLHAIRPDVIVASGVLCLDVAKSTFDILLQRLYSVASRTLVVNMLVQPPHGYPTKDSTELVRWTVQDALRQISLLSCNAWSILHGYLHNDMTLVLRKEFSSFR